MAGALKHYIEITLIPDGIATLNDIWRVIFRQIHLGLVDNKDGCIGLSFPGYRYEQRIKTMGEKLRVFAPSEQALLALNVSKWLSDVSEYCHISKIREVPGSVGYACFGRKHYKTNYEKILKSKMVHLGLTEAEAKEAVGAFEPSKRDLPYIHYQSLSSMASGTSADMVIAIQKREMESEVTGNFNSFGLSNNVTVPVF